MISLMELKDCRHGLHQNVEALRGRTVKLYLDNMTVVGALLKMSSKCPELMSEIKGLVPWLHEHNIHLEVVYIRIEANLTDAKSRQRGLDMWSLQQTVAPRFGTPLHCRHSSAFNGVLLDWSPVFTL
jgi:hypothetical protein